MAILTEIGGLEFYSRSITDVIRKWVSDNPVSVSVAVTNIAHLINRRSEFVLSINSIQSAFEKFEIDADDMDEGTAEIGFLLPRDLFDNNLPTLIKELKTINDIVRTFSEIALGSVEEIEVRDISTTNPIFFLSLDPFTIAMIGGAITWALDAWERVEKIRKIRTETANLEDTKSRADVEQLFAKMIEEAIEKAIKEYSVVVMENAKAEKARRNELKNQLGWALRSILSRIERGMVVEIRRLAPPVEKDEEGANKPAPQAFQDIEKAIPKLVFPRVQGPPIFQLPPSEPPLDGEAKASEKPQKRS